jgi:3-oxoacyl-[acyl-carrier protein] reductase
VPSAALGWTSPHWLRNTYWRASMSSFGPRDGWSTPLGRGSGTSTSWSPTTPAAAPRPSKQLTAAELDHTYAVNTRATLLLAQAFAAQHDGRPGGRILFFTSGQYHGAMPAELPYIASKAALHQLTRSVAVHLMPRGITVNCVDPGPNDTGYADDATRAAVAAANPGGRWGTPTDASRLVAWLVSDEAEWVTGQVIASDGGWSAR